MSSKQTSKDDPKDKPSRADTARRSLRDMPMQRAIIEKLRKRLSQASPVGSSHPIQGSLTKSV
jgi:hypothetical protein